MRLTSDSRRTFIKKSAMGTAGLAMGFSALSYGRIKGANDRLHFAVAGLNNRGKDLTKAAWNVENSTVTHLCDVDSLVLAAEISKVKENTGTAPKGCDDIRKMLESKDIDALAIATPDHWHTPMAIMAIQAGKNVYVEKPCCHNPQEGLMLVEASKKYNKVVQMGNQQRSSPPSRQAIADIHAGLIGKPYFGKAWYANNRKSIGVGKHVPVPENLNWDIWQGPAPRVDYKDNVVHYNWHWFLRWGTGEINNNGIHEIDICRWALGVTYPTKVTSSGGRYHFNYDWEFYDTQVASFEFGDDKMITWEGKSCHPFRYHDRGRGAAIHGTEGTAIIDENSYVAYDTEGKLIKEIYEERITDNMDIIGEGPSDLRHMTNFVNAIREGGKLHSPIEEGNISNLLCHLGNIAQITDGSLKIDPGSGQIKDHPEAMKLWSRSYEPGWEPKF